MLSFIESSDMQLYFINNQITSGAIKHSKNTKDKMPKYGIRVIAPRIAPKNALKIVICLSKIKSIFIEVILAQVNGYGKSQWQLNLPYHLILGDYPRPEKVSPFVRLLFCRLCRNLLKLV